ncbi:MAG: hypothetical protein ACRD6R_12895 [Candidatus Polarisedimenticolia bacterium]
MATAGQLKPKIDLLRKKLADTGAALAMDRKRPLVKRLKRMQRRRRVLLRAEAKVKEAGKGEGKAAAKPAEAGGEAAG